MILIAFTQTMNTINFGVNIQGEYTDNELWYCLLQEIEL